MFFVTGALRPPDNFMCIWQPLPPLKISKTHFFLGNPVSIQLFRKLNLIKTPAMNWLIQGSWRGGGGGQQTKHQTRECKGSIHVRLFYLYHYHYWKIRFYKKADHQEILTGFWMSSKLIAFLEGLPITFPEQSLKQICSCPKTAILPLSLMIAQVAWCWRQVFISHVLPVFTFPEMKYF